MSAPDIPDSAFRLRWRRTWKDHPDDFIARAEAGFCRIYLDKSVAGERWYWTASKDQYQLASGLTDMAREAALEAEAAYFSKTE